MRQTTQNVNNAFANDKAFKSGHDQVVINENSIDLLYRGNLIAYKTKGKLFITTCGYKTNTTKDRLNGIEGVLIKQKDGVWFLNGIEWNGSLIEIK